MDHRKTLYVTERQDWRAWLEKNFDKEKEIWLVFPTKSSGKPRLVYNDAVEEALCFGWIDSIMKTIDENTNMQRFSPRRPESSFSQANKERLKRLYETGMLHPSTLKTAQDILKEKFIFPDDIIENLKRDKVVWRNFSNFSESYKRIRVAYIEGGRKRPDEFRKRLNNFIEKTKANKQIGFGGIEKYY